LGCPALPGATGAALTLFPLYQSRFIESLPEQIALFLLVALGFSVIALALAPLDSP